MDQRTDKSELTVSDKSPNSKNETIFEPRMSSNFWILLKERGSEIPTYQKQIASDYLYRISLSTGKEQLIKCYFELNDNFLFCFKVDPLQPGILQSSRSLPRPRICEDQRHQSPGERSDVSRREDHQRKELRRHSVR